MDSDTAKNLLYQLPLRDQQRCSLVCKLWYAVIKQNQVWENIAVNVYSSRCKDSFLRVRRRFMAFVCRNGYFYTSKELFNFIVASKNMKEHEREHPVTVSSNFGEHAEEVKALMIDLREATEALEEICPKSKVEFLVYCNVDSAHVVMSSPQVLKKLDN
jgi:hypothetical protein